MSGMGRTRAASVARWGLACLVVAAETAGAGGAAAQQAPPPGLRVYLDCQTRGCDFDHFRREIPFATWVRNREDADVHLMVTGRGTGGGGREYTLTFFGRGRLVARQDTVTFTVGQTLTDAEVRDELTRMIGLGLVPFAARNGAAARLRVVAAPPEDGQPAGPPTDGGGWDYWVFRVRAGGFVEGQSQENTISANGGVSASRVTEALKLRLGLSGRYVRDEFEVDEVDEETGDTLRYTDRYTRKNWNANGLVGWSIGNHWAAGATLEVGASTYFNQDFFLQGGPALEYNVFPYAESTRRVLAATLTVGAIHTNYRDTTIFGRLQEVHPVHNLELQFSQRQPWGEIHSNLEWLQYWHDPNVHLVQVFAGAEIRIVKGLSLDLFGRFARVRDQLYLAAAGLSEQEILTRQQARGTDYRFELNFGLSYTFGATDNSIVNPRLDL
jgi:hypothetical protein